MSVEPSQGNQIEPSDSKFLLWRRIHRLSSFMLGLIAIIHCTMTFFLYSGWSPDNVWFLGTGIGLLLLAVVNISHVGLEPCHQPTAIVVRVANSAFLVFGIAAAIAVPEIQAYLVLASLFGQAIAGQNTLRGPA